MSAIFDPTTRMVHAPARDIPVVLDTDVLVCGGGPAGTAAAIAAGRLGARVTIIERYNHLGGLASGGLVIVLPALTDQGRPIVAGIGLQMRDAMLASGEAVLRERADSCYFDPEAFKYFALQFALDAGVDILHHAWLSDVIVAGGVVRGAIFETKSGPQAAIANVVVDATGDGDIFAWAGCAFEKSDQTIGLDFRIGGVDTAKWQAAREGDPDRCAEIKHEIREACDWHGPFELGAVTTAEGVVWGNNGLRVADALDPRALSAIDTEARLKIRQALDLLRKLMPGFAHAWLMDTASQTGVRRTRRLRGVATLTQDHVSQHDSRHPDAVGRGNDFRRQGVAYDIPYGALLPVEVDGLLTCGRCLSCDDEALEPLRVIQVCWVTGQAAGTAAALAARNGVTPRDLPVADLQDVLRGADVAFAD